MNCAEIEILICEYVEGTLGADLKSEVERHFDLCPGCAELAKDSAAAIAFMERAAEVEPPPELITRILFDAPWTKGQSKSKAWAWVRGLLSPILQPKFAMGMAMTILSLSIMAKFVGPVQKIKPEDLSPTHVWASVEDRASRTWARTVKFYENLKFVYQIQTTLREWQQQDEERRAPAQPNPGGPTDDRKIPVKSPPPASPTGSAQ
jgi:anti-sigma factor RsiW